VSIFSNILNKIFSHGQAQAATPSGGSAAGSSSGSAQAGSGAQASTSASSGQGTVDVEPILNNLASKNSQKLDWRHSIVDLMKLLDLDSSLSARKELAQELKYTGDTNDSASMNVWLHKQVMRKLAENGGKVPEDLKS
jgi:hypothetical protein